MSEQIPLLEEHNGLAGQRFEPHVFVRHDAPETSRAAAKKVLGRTGSQRRKVYDAIARFPLGLTDAEILLETGINPNSVRPRRIELRDAELIYCAGERNGMSVWRVK